MKRKLPIIITMLLLVGCGKDSEASVNTEVPVVTETSTETEAVPAEESSETETSNEPSTAESGTTTEKHSENVDGIIGTWTQTEEDEEIVSLTFDENTYTYSFDYSRAYEPGEEIDEDPVSGTSDPLNYFLDAEYVIELDDTTLTQINMTMDDVLGTYGNCGIYDSAANAIYIGDSFNNVLVHFIQEEHKTEAEWQEYIEDEYYLTFVRK